MRTWSRVQRAFRDRAVSRDDRIQGRSWLYSDGESRGPWSVSELRLCQYAGSGSGDSHSPAAVSRFRIANHESATAGVHRRTRSLSAFIIALRFLGILQLVCRPIQNRKRAWIVNLHCARCRYGIIPSVSTFGRTLSVRRTVTGSLVFIDMSCSFWNFCPTASQASPMLFTGWRRPFFEMLYS